MMLARLLVAPSILLAASGFSQSLGSRFTSFYTPGSLPPITIDSVNSGWGFANAYARQHHVQGRILWVDGTANLDRLSSAESIQNMVQKAQNAGFNTIVLDVKPISGQVLYPSVLAPKITAWKTQKLPASFDPLAAMVKATKSAGLNLQVSLNAFSEGHNLFKAGPGYDRPDEQSVIYVSQPAVDVLGSSQLLTPKPNSKPAADMIGVYTDPASLPEAASESYAISVDAFAKVVDGFEGGGTGRGVPTIPKGGCVLVGTGEQALWLREFALPGTRLNFTDRPLFKRTGELPSLQYPLMMNPHHPGVVSMCRAIVKELLTNYDIDGIVYDDRLRYAGLTADFSELTRRAFEARVHQTLVWPDDVFRVSYTPTLQKGLKPGRFYDAWMTFRADTIKGFVDEIRHTVKSTKPTASFGIYAGSWYGDYEQYGSNYAAPDLRAGFWFQTADYRATGFGDRLDFLVTGCYYPTATIYEAFAKGQSIGATIESAGQLSNRIANDQTWAYAGLSLDQFAGHPEELAKALQACMATTQGVMVFDYSHGIDAFWNTFREAFVGTSKAPHTIRGALEVVRKRRQDYVKAGGKIPPVPIAAGSSGVGF